MNRLNGKIAIITGAAQGMGASHARLFVEEGAKVVLTDVNETAGAALAAELGSKARFVKQDVTNEADWDKVIVEAEATFGPVNVLVNNAAIDHSGKIEDTTVEQYDKLIAVNQKSVFLGMRAVLKSMRKAGGGSIVNISSIAGIKAMADKIPYSASKFAVKGMSHAAALEFAEFGVRVNSVHPGVIDTPMVAAADNLDLVIQSIPLRKIAKPSDVSNLVLFLASDESSYSTGSEFAVDGGLSSL